MIDGILYVGFFIGGFIMVLCIADVFARLLIRLIESGKHYPMWYHVEQARKKRYNSKTREYKA